MKKILPIAAALGCGLVMLIDFFVAEPRLDAIGAAITEGVMILAAFALLLGILNLLNVHAQRVLGESGRLPSLVLMIALLATLAVGVALPGSAAVAWVFDYLYSPLQSTLAALLAFFAISAAYRAFRLRNAEALILLVTSVLVLLAQMPFSGALSPLLPLMRDWILGVPVAAGVRGIILGVALGTIATSLRVLLTVDRPYAGE